VAWIENGLIGVSIGLLLIAAIVFVPGLVLAIECVAALFPRRDRLGDAPLQQPRLDVLVPAHNEEGGITTTVEAIRSELAAGDRLIVVADNCVDQTAALASKAGATVLERYDTERRGKGYALDYGIQYIAASPPDVVVIMDADCIAERDSLRKIATLAALKQRPVQAVYLMAQPPNPSPKDSISMLAFTFKNLVRPVGLDRLSLPCLLTGTGMAFPWPLIKDAPLASGNIVEDMQLGLDLAIAGAAPLLGNSARVTSVLPQKREAAKSQRTRWEHGHLHTLKTQVPRLLLAGLRQGRLDLLSLAFDLCVPPLSLLVMMWLLLLIVSAIAAWAGASPLPLILLGIEGGLIVGSIILGWAKFCRRELPAKTLLMVPLYILWKIPLYCSFLFKPQKAWVRTERDTPR